MDPYLYPSFDVTTWLLCAAGVLGLLSRHPQYTLFHQPLPLFSLSSCVPQMGILPSPWNELSFVSKGEVTCSALRCENCITTILHHIRTSLYNPTAEAIDAALAVKPDVNILESFTFEYSGVNFVRVCKTIYFPGPYVRMLLKRNLTPTKAWI